MFRKLFPIFVAMVVVLAFGSVHAQTTVNIAIRSSPAVDVTNLTVQILDSSEPPLDTSEPCWSAHGFSDESPVVRAVFFDSSVALRPEVTTNIALAPGTRLVNLSLLDPQCSSGGTLYNVYSADVSTTIGVVIAVGDSFAVLPGDDLVVTGFSLPALVFQSLCMGSWGFSGPEFGARIVRLHASSPGLTPFSIRFSRSIPPGTRLNVCASIATCLEGGVAYDILVAAVKAPTPGGPLVVAAPTDVLLDSNSEAVAKSDSDPDGISNFVCLQPGSGALHTELWCDVPIERGDRIVGFHSPLVDPDTGITYWWAELEY